MGGQGGAVAGQRQAECLGQAVHGIGGKHARTGAAGGAGGFLHLGQAFIRYRVVCRGGNGGDEVGGGVGYAINHDGFAGLHRSARDENGGNVQAQRRIEHARGDFIAVGDAHQGVGSVGIGHVLDGIGDDFARRQRVEHAAVSHGDAIIDSDGIEFLRYAAGLAYGVGDDIANVFKVYVAGDELGIGVGNGDDRFAKVIFLGAGGPPEGAGSRGLAADGSYF